MDDIIRLVSGVGFPIVVAIYVLLRLEFRLTEVRDAVRELLEIHKRDHGKS